MTMTSLVRLDAVTYAYPDAPRYTLDHASWAVAAGETHLVLGPSGAGKSTLLRTFNGLVPQFTGGRFGGVVFVAGQAAHRLGPRAMSAVVGMLFQDPESAAIAPRVADDVAFALEQAGVPRAEMRRRVADALAAVGIAHLAERALATLSGGERQRAALAAALVRAPRLLVLDEPTSQLDPTGARDVLDAVAAVQRAHGTGVVLAEHRLERVVADAVGAAFLPGNGSLKAGETRAQLRRLAASPDAGIDWLPPVTALGLACGWEPLPLTVAAARPFLARDGLDHVSTRPTLPVPVVRAAHSTGVPLVAARGVTVRQGAATTLRDADLAVHAGEIVALVGENGAGKTTLLRALLGVQPVASGQVLLAGRDVTAAGVRARLAVMPLGYVPQQPGSLLFAETVADELHLTLAAHGRQAMPARFGSIEGLLAAFGLAGMAERYPRDLSVGERARLAIAVTLAADPPLVLLDEPTRGLDPGAKRALAAILRALRDDGRGVLLVTHDAELVARVADRVALMAGGRIIAVGEPRAVLAGTPFASQISQLTGGAFLTAEEMQCAIPAVVCGESGIGNDRDASGRA